MLSLPVTDTSDSDLFVCYRHANRFSTGDTVENRNIANMTVIVDDDDDDNGNHNNDKENDKNSEDSESENPIISSTLRRSRYRSGLPPTLATALAEALTSPPTPPLEPKPKKSFRDSFKKSKKRSKQEEMVSKEVMTTGTLLRSTSGRKRVTICEDDDGLIDEEENLVIS